MTATADSEGEQRHDADGDRPDRQRGRLQRSAGRDAAAVGGKAFQQRVLDDDGQAEGDEQRRQDVVAQRAVEHMVLQQPAGGEHRRRCDQRGDERIEAEACDKHQDEEGGEHDQVAMGEVDQPHDAEDQAEPRREQGVEPAEQHALDDGVEPVHAATPK